MARCGACGRRLARPSPTGLGPVCARRLGLTSRPPTVIRSTNTQPDHIPGQTELPLVEHQPTLWSL
ncbi:hypothetical protein [Streptomyces sp. NPDC086182]|jgi:hypothetical protein|uniref:hypothetical protein n=1 Tax=Streptomyces sp. NPDC086182 TaxID=3155058 RepID=UPI0034443181